MKHSEFKPHAAITLSNSGGIEIMLNRSNDGVYYRFNYGQEDLENEEIFESEIFYGETNEANDSYEETAPYFKHNGNIYSLNEAMRTS